MKKDNHIILAVHITDRVKKAPMIQKILSQYGCHIKTRLGLHEASTEFCSPNGLVLLEMLDDLKTVKALQGKLDKIAGVETKRLVFGH
jgi:hypothetical protein